MSKPRRKFSERPSKTFTNVDGQVFKVFGQTVLVTCKIGKDFSVAQFKMPDNGKIMGVDDVEKLQRGTRAVMDILFNDDRKTWTALNLIIPPSDEFCNQNEGSLSGKNTLKSPIRSSSSDRSRPQTAENTKPITSVRPPTSRTNYSTAPGLRRIEERKRCEKDVVSPVMADKNWRDKNSLNLSPFRHRHTWTQKESPQRSEISYRQDKNWRQRNVPRDPLLNGVSPSKPGFKRSHTADCLPMTENLTQTCSIPGKGSSRDRNLGVIEKEAVGKVNLGTEADAKDTNKLDHDGSDVQPEVPELTHSNVIARTIETVTDPIPLVAADKVEDDFNPKIESENSKDYELKDVVAHVLQEPTSVQTLEQESSNVTEEDLARSLEPNQILLSLPVSYCYGAISASGNNNLVKKAPMRRLETIEEEDANGRGGAARYLADDGLDVAAAKLESTEKICREILQRLEMLECKCSEDLASNKRRAFDMIPEEEEERNETFSNEELAQECIENNLNELTPVEEQQQGQAMSEEANVLSCRDLEENFREEKKFIEEAKQTGGLQDMGEISDEDSGRLKVMDRQWNEGKIGRSEPIIEEEEMSCLEWMTNEEQMSQMLLEMNSMNAHSLNDVLCTMDTTKGVCGDIGAAQGEGDKTFQPERDVKEVAERVSEKAQISVFLDNLDLFQKILDFGNANVDAKQLIDEFCAKNFQSHMP